MSLVDWKQQPENKGIETPSKKAQLTLASLVEVSLGKVAVGLVIIELELSGTNRPIHRLDRK